MYFNDDTQNYEINEEDELNEARHKHHKEYYNEMPFYMYPMSYCPYIHSCPMKQYCKAAKMYFNMQRMEEEDQYRQPYNYSDKKYPPYHHGPQYYPYQYYPYYPPYYPYHPYEYSDDDHDNHDHDHDHDHDYDHDYDHVHKHDQDYDYDHKKPKGHKQPKPPKGPKQTRDSKNHDYNYDHTPHAQRHD